MAKIIYLPLEHIESRYTVHMDRDMTDYLKRSNLDYIRIYPDFNDGSDKLPMRAGSFLDAEYTIRFKAAQIAELARLYRADIINDGDIIFSSDIWHPGLPESVAYMNYFTKKDVKLRGLIHAGSFTDTDFVRDMERWGKNFEDMIFDISDRVYCASEFIRQDIIKKRFVDPNKLQVTGLPLDVANINEIRNSIKDVVKEDIVVFNGRNVDEKQPWLFDQLKRRMTRPGIKFVNTLQENMSKEEYYKLLSKAKVVVSYALQENFGYGIAEAVMLGCAPVLPKRLVYPELYHKKYLYDTFDDSCRMVQYFIDNYDTVKPDLSNDTNLIINNDKIFSRWFNA